MSDIVVSLNFVVAAAYIRQRMQHHYYTRHGGTKKTRAGRARNTSAKLVLVLGVTRADHADKVHNNICREPANTDKKLLVKTDS